MTQKRATRQAAGRRVLTPRELVALRFLSDAQPMTTYDVQTLLGVSYAIALRSVRKFRDLGVVTVHVPRMDGPNVLTLTEVGRRELARVSGEDASTFRVTRTLGSANLRHHGLGVRFAAALTVACARAPRLTLNRYVFESKLRAALGADGQDALIPDGVAVVESASGGLGVALEADCATENPSWFLRHKALPLAELAEAGEPLLGAATWRVAIVTEHPRRLERLAASLWGAGLPGGLFYLALASDLTAEAILTDAPWITWDEGAPGEDAQVVRRSPFAPGRTAREVRHHGRLKNPVGSTVRMAGGGT